MNLRSTGFRAMEKTEVPKGGTHVEPGEHLSASTLLTGRSFWDETTFHEELERFYFRSWLNVGRSDQIPDAGDFFVREVGNESLLFIRGGTTRCGDSTTSAGIEGPESSARQRGPSSDPWCAHTTRGRIRRRESSWALPTRSDSWIFRRKSTVSARSAWTHGAASFGRASTTPVPPSARRWANSSRGS